MHRGYIKLWRRAKLSPVWQMPPLYNRVWTWIISSVNYIAKQIPTPTGIITVQPGQRITSLRQIAEEVSWYEYGVLKIPNVKTIKTILDWLESNAQCTVESNAKGTLITVINWNTYNGDNTEEVTEKEQPEVTQNKQTPDTNKKEPKNKTFIKPSVLEVEAYMNEIGFNGNAQHFVDSNIAKGWVVGTTKTPMKDWKAAVRTWHSNDKKRNPQQELLPVLKVDPHAAARKAVLDKYEY